MSSDPLSIILGLFCGITFIALVTVLYIRMFWNEYGQKARLKERDLIPHEIVQVVSPIDKAMWELNDIGSRKSIEKSVETVKEEEPQPGNQKPELKKEQIEAEVAPSKPKRKRKRGRRRK